MAFIRSIPHEQWIELKVHCPRCPWNGPIKEAVYVPDSAVICPQCKAFVIRAVDSAPPLPPEITAGMSPDEFAVFRGYLIQFAETRKQWRRDIEDEDGLQDVRKNYLYAMIEGKVMEPDWLTKARNEGRVKDGPMFQTSAIVDDFAKVEAIKKRAKPPQLVDAKFERGPISDVPQWTIPLRVVAGDNARGLRAKIGRAGHERTACTREFAKQHRAWEWAVTLLQRYGGIRVALTRIGGRTMDYANVVAAMKYVQDTAAAWLGVDDADNRIQWIYDQRPGGSKHGVEVRLEAK